MLFERLFCSSRVKVVTLCTRNAMSGSTVKNMHSK
ncbi:unnamed protein product [Chondrus crispus]|uniref:Uncharacterized protein n=1 Tax=Chondrus crispus TaxID=2769 RepID=R7QAI0_CHOCR|nr:unnamed protein product [Chondrus crispus]CDF34431.1 unnamed protein product [Chondrus crispus]|eukprot:XP_005714250.1 unnamed protein product [Chondrus crispus]